MSEKELHEAEVKVMGHMAVDAELRVQELERERDKLRFDLQSLREALMQANNVAAELRARLFSIGLLLRP